MVSVNKKQQFYVVHRKYIFTIPFDVNVFKGAQLKIYIPNYKDEEVDLNEQVCRRKTANVIPGNMFYMSIVDGFGMYKITTTIFIYNYKFLQKKTLFCKLLH